MKVAKADCGIRFRLRDPKSTSSSPIVCFVEYDGKPVIKIATGLKIIPSKWNADKEKPVTGMKGLSNEDANFYLDRLSNIRSLVDKQYRTYVNLNVTFPDKGSFKKTIINELLGIEEGPEVKDPSLINFIDQQIKRTKTGIRVKLSGTGKGQSFSGASVLSYQGTKNFLIAYLSERKKKGLTFDEVTQEFYWDLQDYFFNDRKLSLNYFGKVIKHIKSFMREAEELGYHNNEIYKSKRFLKPQEETDAIYLNVEQLKLIQDLDLAETGYLDNARDLFLIGCWTGLRFHDYSQLITNSKIIGDFIHISKTAKTGAGVAIPLLPVVKDILKKYENSEKGLFPHSITNQKLNEYIKIIAERAKLTQPVQISIPVAGKRKIITQPLHNLVTTHSARRSFATNMYRHYNLPPTTIMKVTGHKSEAVFLKYIRMTPEENAQLILEAVNKRYESDDLITAKRKEEVQNG
jgi:integrase